MKKLKRLLVYIVALVAALTLCCILYMQTVMRFQANKLVQREEYSAAALIYDKIGSGKKAQQCMQLQTQKEYLDAKTLMESGEYDAARAAFVVLAGYMDSDSLIESCDYLKAEALLAEGKFQQARDLLLTVPNGYPGRAETLEASNRCLYETAMDLALQGEYADAGDIWRQLGKYNDSDRLVFRMERMLDWLEGDARLTGPGVELLNKNFKNVFANENAYIIVPEKYDENCRFLLYYPGGMDYELNIDFLYYYLMNPAPNTFAVFMRRNGIEYMEEKNSQALEIMDKTAAECGVFVHDIVVVGSSMGAYLAVHSPRLSMKELGISVDCVLALDAGGDWDYEYCLRPSQCLETSKLGTEFYLFESPHIGLNRPPIKMMVENGLDITMVGCYFDEHERMTYDAMGMGVLHWALGDRSKPCPLEIYTFNKLELQ